MQAGKVISRCACGVSGIPLTSKQEDCIPKGTIMTETQIDNSYGTNHNNNQKQRIGGHHPLA